MSAASAAMGRVTIEARMRNALSYGHAVWITGFFDAGQPVFPELTVCLSRYHPTWSLLGNRV